MALLVLGAYMASGGNLKTGSTALGYDGHIGFDTFVIVPNLKDVHGNIWDPADFHTSESGWTIQIYDLNKNYLGTWHYDECVDWRISPDYFPGTTPAGQVVAQGSGGPYNPHVILEDNIRLTLHSSSTNTTHIHGPDPIVNYGNWFYPNMQPGQIGGLSWTVPYNHVMAAAANLGTIPAQKVVIPEYYAGNDLYGSNFGIHSSSFAYIKIVTDKNRITAECTNISSQLGGPAFLTPAYNPNPPNQPGTAKQGFSYPVGGTVQFFAPPNPLGFWFEDIYTGPNTTPNQMNVMCLPCTKYIRSLNPGAMPIQWTIGIIGTRCCDINSLPKHPSIHPCSGHHDNPNYPGMDIFSHWLHLWPASHKVMPNNGTWYQNLATGYPQCRIGPGPLPGNSCV